MYAIQHSYAKAVSGGSFKESCRMLAFLLFGTTEEPLLLWWNGVLGSLKMESAYRNELAGIAGIIMGVELICNRCDITQGSIEVGLDGSEALH
jgi:hypothetical protein